jgi:hypothetical protein
MTTSNCAQQGPALYFAQVGDAQPRALKITLTQYIDVAQQNKLKKASPLMDRSPMGVFKTSNNYFSTIG